MNKIQLRFDSNERLFEIKSDFFQGYDFFYDFKKLVLEKSLAQLLDYHFDEYSQSLENINLVQAFKVALYEYRGDVILTDVVTHPLDELVCRCNKLFEKDIDEFFKKVKGNKKEFLKESNATMLCGGCSDYVESYLLKSADEFFAGKSLAEYEVEIQNELDDFLMHSPYSTEQVSFILDKVLAGKIRIRANRSDRNLKKEDMLKTLKDFFPRSLTQVFEISLVISDI